MWRGVQVRRLVGEDAKQFVALLQPLTLLPVGLQGQLNAPPLYSFAA